MSANLANRPFSSTRRGNTTEISASSALATAIKLHGMKIAMLIARSIQSMVDWGLNRIGIET